MLRSTLCFLLFAAGLQALPMQSYDLDISSGCCGSGPYGTVTLTQNGPNEIDFSIMLNDPFVFVSSGFPGVFAFNLNVAPANLTITLDAASIAAGFSGSTGNNTNSLHFDGFGYFDYAITPDAAHSNPSHPLGKTLSFSVVDSAGPISFGSFEIASINGDNSSIFGADIKNTTLTNNETGIVGNGGAFVQSLPEPGTLAAAGAALLTLGLLRRHRAA